MVCKLSARDYFGDSLLALLQDQLMNGSINYDSHLYIDTRQRKLPPRFHVSGHVPEELFPVLVPLDRVENVCGAQLPPAGERGTGAQRHVRWHPQLQQLQGCYSII